MCVRLWPTLMTRYVCVAKSVCSRCTMEFQPHSQLPLQLIEKLGKSLGARLGFITFRSCKLDFTYTVSLSSRRVWYITECMLPANEGMYKHIHMHMQGVSVSIATHKL